MATEKRMRFEELMAIAQASASVARNCECAVESSAGWGRISMSFPERQMRVVGTFVDDPYAEPTFAEFHPAGTNYWSADAPIALGYFPYNRCSVLQCVECGRAYLKYVEAGGYYVEPRIRALDPRLIVDDTAPATPDHSA